MSKAPDLPSSGNARSIASAIAIAAAEMVRLMIDHLFDLHLVFEMQVKVGEQITKQWVGRQPVGQCFGHPLRRRGTGLAQLLAHPAPTTAPTLRRRGSTGPLYAR